MKYLTPILILALLAISIWGAVTGVRGLLERRGAPKDLLALLPEASPSLVYQLDQEKWTSFKLPVGQNPIRVLITAGLPDAYRTARLPENQEWQFAVEYQIIDSSGKVLREKVYHLKTKLTKYRDDPRNLEYTASFFLSPRLQPSDARSMMVNLNGLDKPASLRIRQHAAGADVQALYARVYSPQSSPEFKLRSIWQRMTTRQKTRLAGGNVYPRELVTEEEKRNMTSTLWSPIGPSGVVKRDYRPLELYTLIENEALPLNQATPPAGLFIDPDHAAVFPLGEHGKTITLRFVPVDTDTASDGKISVSWYGRGVTQRSSRTLVWEGKPLEVTYHYGGGMIVVSGTQSFVARAFTSENGSLKEITPEPYYIRAYQLEPGASLEFPVEHEGDQPTPFRIEIRRQAASGIKNLPELTVGYRLLDKDRKVVASGQIQVPFKLSRYETVAGILPAPLVSEPAPFHFMVPSPVRYLQIVSENPVLVSAYNRPFALPYSLSVPQDYFRTYQQTERQPAWFPLYHPDHERLVLANRTTLLITQIKPPEDDPELLAGQYFWEDFRPERSDWLARRIVTIWEHSIPFQTDALPSLFRRLVEGLSSTVMLQAEPGLTTVVPTLLYFQKGSSGYVRVSVDGKTAFQGTIFGQVGEIRLPVLAASRHDIKVNSPPGSRFYINQAGSGLDSLQIRLANRVQGRELSFMIEKKRYEEMLSLRYYAPEALSGQTINLKVICEQAHETGGPWASWTFRERHFAIRLDPARQAFALGSAGERLIGGDVLYIPLGDDLAAGRYRFKVIIERPSAGYLTLSRTTPGKVDKRKSIYEEVIRHVEISE